MSIVWNGKGIYIPIIFGVCLYAYYLFFIDDPKMHVLDSYGLPIAFLVTGICCFFMAAEWKSKEGKVRFDPKKKKEVLVRPDHSFYLLNVYYWSYILTALGLIIFYFKWK
jgi:hypothetical protein